MRSPKPSQLSCAMTVNRDSLNGSDLQNKEARIRDTPGLAGTCSAKEKKLIIRKKVEMVHNQVARIREEDVLVGEDVAGGGGSEKIGGQNRNFASSPVFFARPILPCSPLGGKDSQRHGIALN